MLVVASVYEEHTYTYMHDAFEVASHVDPSFSLPVAPAYLTSLFKSKLETHVSRGLSFLRLCMFVPIYTATYAGIHFSEVYLVFAHLHLYRAVL